MSSDTLAYFAQVAASIMGVECKHRALGRDIAGALRGLTVPFDLIVTTVAGRERLIESVRRS